MSDESKFTTGQVLAVDGGWSVSEGQVPVVASVPGEAPPQQEHVFRTLGKLWGRLTKGK